MTHAHPADPTAPTGPTQPSHSAAPPVLAEVVRSGFVESRHRGSLVALAADGSTLLALGDPDAPCYPRSTNKPLQASAMLRVGLQLPEPQLAIAAASHAGEEVHLAAVRRLLDAHGLREEQLGNPPDLPLDPEEQRRWTAAGRGPARIAMNCSGKHAAMLATCRLCDWPLETYRSPDHPLQQRVRQELAELCGEPVAHTGVDGCGAPLMAVSLTGLARAFQRLVTAPPDSPPRRVADAMRAHPVLVAGTRRIDTWLMEGVPGALAKVGAEAVQAVALPDGRALAFSIEDGAARAVGPVLARALALLGVTAPVLERIAHAPVLGGGAPVGEVRAAF